MSSILRQFPSPKANMYTIGTKKTGNDGNLWRVSQDINGRHIWIMARNQTYNLARSKTKSKTKPKTKPKTKSKTKSKNKRTLARGNSKSISKSTSKSTSKSKERKGPSYSATLYKIGTKKIGNDGNRWIIAESSNGVKRWKLYKKINDSESDIDLEKNTKKLRHTLAVSGHKVMKSYL